MFVGKTISPEPEAGSRCCALRRRHSQCCVALLFAVTAVAVSAAAATAAVMQSLRCAKRRDTQTPHTHGLCSVNHLIKILSTSDAACRAWRPTTHPRKHVMVRTSCSQNAGLWIVAANETCRQLAFPVTTCTAFL